MTTKTKPKRQATDLVATLSQQSATEAETRREAGMNASRDLTEVIVRAAKNDSNENDASTYRSACACLDADVSAEHLTKLISELRLAIDEQSHLIDRSLIPDRMLAAKQKELEIEASIKQLQQQHRHVRGAIREESSRDLESRRRIRKSIDALERQGLDRKILLDAIGVCEADIAY